MAANAPQNPITRGSAPALHRARLPTPGRLSGSGSALPKPQGPWGGEWLQETMLRGKGTVRSML